MSMSPQDIAAKYRKEAEELRSAVQVIRDEGLCRQLLSFAQQYEADAMLLELEQQPIAA